MTKTAKADALDILKRYIGTANCDRYNDMRVVREEIARLRKENDWLHSKLSQFTSNA
jgi:hypothetical protein